MGTTFIRVNRSWPDRGRLRKGKCVHRRRRTAEHEPRNDDQKPQDQWRRHQVGEHLLLQSDHAATSSLRLVFTLAASESKLDSERLHYIRSPTESAFRVSTDGYCPEIASK